MGTVNIALWFHIMSVHSLSARKLMCKWRKIKIYTDIYKNISIRHILRIHIWESDHFKNKDAAVKNVSLWGSRRKNFDCLIVFYSVSLLAMSSVFDIFHSFSEHFNFRGQYLNYFQSREFKSKHFLNFTSIAWLKYPFHMFEVHIAVYCHNNARSNQCLFNVQHLSTLFVFILRTRSIFSDFVWEQWDNGFHAT